MLGKTKQPLVGPLRWSLRPLLLSEHWPGGAWGGPLPPGAALTVCGSLPLSETGWACPFECCADTYGVAGPREYDVEGEAGRKENTGATFTLTRRRWMQTVAERSGCRRGEVWRPRRGGVG